MIEIKFTLDPTKGNVFEQLCEHVSWFIPASENLGVVVPHSAEVVGVTRVTPDSPVETEPTEPKKRGRKAKETSSVATKDIAAEVASPDVNDQDVADEAAEAASDTLTHDDVRAAVGRYTKQFGIVAAQKNVPPLLGCPIAEIPDDPAAIKLAIRKLEEAMGLPATPVTPALFDEPPAPVKDITEQDVRDALMAYAAKYDVDDKMANTLVDGPDILKKTFGPTISALRLVPKDPASLKKAYDAVHDAIENNWYNRKVVR